MSAQPATEQAPATQSEEQTPAVSLPEQQTTTALALVTQSITELNRVALEVAALEPKYKGVVFDVKTTAGMKAACEARLAIRKPRYTIQKMQKDAKTPLNALKKGIDDQVDAVIARISAIEDPVHQQIANEELRRENEKKARDEAEAKRVADIHARIDLMRQYPLDAVGKSSAHIEEVIKAVVAIPIDESFSELKQQAEGAKATTLIRLRAALANAQAHEEQQRQLATERLRLAEEREAAERAQATARARIAEEERVAKAAREAEERRQTEARELAEARLGEIQGIQHQVFIASTGRLGVRKGGTRECIVETLLETEAWEITEEKFGPLMDMAREAKISAVSQIIACRDRWDALVAEGERSAAAAKRQREESERLEAARKEADRLEAERKAAADAEQLRIDERLAAAEAHERRLAETQAQLERDQEALRAEREKPASVSDDSVEEDRVFEIMSDRKAAQIERESGPVAPEPAVETPVAAEPDPLTASLDLKVYLLMDSVCKFAKEWAVFQQRDSKLDQKTDRKLAARAREAEANLLAVVEQLP